MYSTKILNLLERLLIKNPEKRIDWKISSITSGFMIKLSVKK